MAPEKINWTFTSLYLTDRVDDTKKSHNSAKCTIADERASLTCPETDVVIPKDIVVSKNTSVLYRIAPELRKQVFNAVLELFWEWYPDRRNITFQFEYTTDKKNAIKHRMYAGFEEHDLPALEVALFADQVLHGEFISARVEASIISMAPDESHPFDGRRYFRFPCYPDLDSVSQLIRSGTRTVKYDICPRQHAQTRHNGYPRNINVIAGLQKLRKVLPMLVDEDLKSSLSDSDFTHPTRVFPNLRKIIIEFPNYDWLGGYQSVVKSRFQLWKGLRDLFSNATIKEFAFQDTRKQSPTMEVFDESGENLFRPASSIFDEFGSDLNELFGFEGEITSTIPRHKRSFQVRQTWKVDDQRALEWNNAKLEEILAKSGAVKKK